MEPCVTCIIICKFITSLLTDSILTRHRDVHRLAAENSSQCRPSRGSSRVTGDTGVASQGACMIRLTAISIHRQDHQPSSEAHMSATNSQIL